MKQPGTIHLKHEQEFSAFQIKRAAEERDRSLNLKPLALCYSEQNRAVTPLKPEMNNQPNFYTSLTSKKICFVGSIDIDNLTLNCDFSSYSAIGNLLEFAAALLGLLTGRQTQSTKQ